MRNYKLTLPRTILFSILLLGGIYYFVKNGFSAMAAYEIVLSAVLMVILLALILLKMLGSGDSGP
ncbi:hypothetical protein [Muriicola sp.]|uniref:hypothetical protein n=1 Tax=Muriicola sp. TaxID=2020856 RepID=UPI003565F3FC